MSEDRRTKAQLVEALNKAERDLQEAERRIPAVPSPVPAASALAGCIRALDPLVKRDSYGQAPTAEVEQVIRHLVGRYRLALVDPVMIPCDRKHLDDATDADLVARLRGVFR